MLLKEACGKTLQNRASLDSAFSEPDSDSIHGRRASRDGVRRRQFPCCTINQYATVVHTLDRGTTVVPTSNHSGTADTTTQQSTTLAATKQSATVAFSGNDYCEWH